MENEEIELKEEEILFIESLKDKINATEYSELRNIINKYEQLARNKDWEARRNEERYNSVKESRDEGNKLYYQEKEQKEKWKANYDDICCRYAKLEIELDIAKAKIRILEGEKK